MKLSQEVKEETYALTPNAPVTKLLKSLRDKYVKKIKQKEDELYQDRSSICIRSLQGLEVPAACLPPPTILIRFNLLKGQQCISFVAVIILTDDLQYQ